ncbi:MAG TPA: C4-type zinc ribbon domain-containing protein [Edaphobacter sp.]|nr:C4-type zinc ribbon domain-containing protein [Edaphobacter sp.]
MHPDLEKLIELQRLDLEARRLRDEIAARPKRIAELEAKAKAATEQKATVLDRIAKEETLRRQQELDVKDHQAKIARVRRQLEMATTTAQVTAFEHEIAFAQAEVSRLEDAELESMERSESLEAQKTAAEEAVEDTAKALERERQLADEADVRDQSALTEVEAKQTALRPEIGEATLANYDRIARGKGTALAEALNQKCMACQMMLRPQRWNDLRNRDNEEEIMTCESCGRLLYYDPARDAPQRKTVQSESIAASIVRSL